MCEAVAYTAVVHLYRSALQNS